MEFGDYPGEDGGYSSFYVSPNLPAAWHINGVIKEVCSTYDHLVVDKFPEKEHSMFGYVAIFLAEGLDCLGSIGNPLTIIRERVWAHCDNPSFRLLDENSEFAAEVAAKVDQDTWPAISEYVNRNREIIGVSKILVWLFLVSYLLRKPDEPFSLKFLTPSLEERLAVEGRVNLVAGLALFAAATQKWARYLDRRGKNSVKSDVSRIGSIAAAAKWHIPKSAVQKRARELWASDGDKPRTIASLVDLLLKELVESPEHYQAPRPPSAATVRKWIKEEAPAQVSRPGRPPKK
tara:strand:+ start:189 stop:1058 length:870 start_codon:yes stop_codon:yes gene_type:complete